ncbi:hypothetical protein VTO73DRAFT_6162 [Trametes versicolor]
MAFIQASDSTLARDLWPDRRGRLINDVSELDTLPPRKIVPFDYDSLSSWVCVDPCGVDTSCAAWIHPDAAGDNERIEVSVRVQGFVHKASLGMLGNWNGTAMGAPKAVQTVTLVSGGCGAAFDPQVTALENLKDRVLCMLSRSDDVADVSPSQIVFRRRVFQKVGGCDTSPPPVEVPVAEDPLRRARKIEHMWVVTHTIAGGIQQPDGRITRVNPSVIRVGDFVDVAMTLQVISFRLPRGRRGVEVLFVPQTVVRLCSAEQAAVMMRSIAKEDELTDVEEANTMVTRDLGIEFEGEDAAMQTTLPMRRGAPPCLLPNTLLHKSFIMATEMNDDVLLNMVQFMSLPTLRAFSEVAPQHAEWITSHLDSAYDAALSSYVSDTSAFRSNMRMLGAVISGSFALSFLLRNHAPPFMPQDMDLYVPKTNARRFARYLITVEGYQLERTTRVPYGRVVAHQLVIQLKRGAKRIEVIPSTNDSSLYPISHFWATHLMNFLSSDTYCMAYPELTFSGRAVLSPFQLIDHRFPSEYIASLVAKYEARGFDIRVRPYAWTDAPSHGTDGGDATCPRVRRFFGDRYCAHGRLSRSAEDCGYPRMLPGAQTVYWWRGGDECGDECQHQLAFPERRFPSAGLLEANYVDERM